MTTIDRSTGVRNVSFDFDEPCKIRAAYDASNNMTHRGVAFPGTWPSNDGWQIEAYTYDVNNNMTASNYAFKDGVENGQMVHVWADYATLQYNEPDAKIQGDIMAFFINPKSGNPDFWGGIKATAAAIITGLWEFRPSFLVGDGTDTHIVKAYQEPGAGGQLRIGIDTDRMLVLADAADVIADDDFGLTTPSDPTFTVMSADKATYLSLSHNQMLFGAVDGLASRGAGILDLKIGGTNQLTLTNGKITNSNQPGQWSLGATSGTVPVFCTRSTTTGTGSAGTDQLSLIGGGVEGIRVDPTKTTIKGGQNFKRTDAGAADYNPSILTTDFLIVANNTAAVRAITISTEDVQSGSTSEPRHFIIKDEYGQAGTNNLTISLESGNIDGAATAVLSGAYNSINLYVDGTNGFIYQEAIMAYITGAGDPTIRHIPKFAGELWFVTKSGNDSNDGLSPDNAKLTIGATVTAAAAGDAITVKAGDYTENVTWSKNGLELWGEIGCNIIGTFTLSANTCKVQEVVFQKDSGVPLTVSGLGNKFYNSKSMPQTGTGSTNGVVVSGQRNEFYNFISAGYTGTYSGYDVSAALNRFHDCEALGQGAATRGWYLSNTAADGTFLTECISNDNATASVETVAGVTGCFFELHSGAGDGRWVDAAETNVWRITYDQKIRSLLDIAQAGAGTWEYNLFKITGTVQINSIVGIVDTVLTGSNTACYLQVYSANNSEVITKATGVTIGAALKGAFMARLDKAGTAMFFADVDGPFIADEVDAKSESFRLGEDRTGAAHVATYIRFIHTTGGASTGEIDFYVDWSPTSHDGFLAAA